MKMMYNGTQIKSLNIKHYEIDTNSCDMIASDLQAGKTAVARGKKITGTGRAFSFATYGDMDTNVPWPIPMNINVIEIASTNYPIQHIIPLNEMKNLNFDIEQNIANVTIDGEIYQVAVNVSENMLNIICDRSITLQVFFGKDEYII